MRNLIAFVILLLCLPCSLLAAPPASRPGSSKDAEIVSAKGDGWVRFIREEEWRQALIEQLLTAGDTLRTGSYGKMDVLFIDGTQIKVHTKTVLTIKEVQKPAEKRGTSLALKVGEIWSRAKSTPESLKIETPSATAAIRGTDWDIAVDESGTSYLTVLAGTVDLSNDYGNVRVEAGEQAMAEIGKPPVKMFLVRPKDRVQWIISYPLRIPRIMAFFPSRTGIVTGQVDPARTKVQADPADVKAKIALAGLLFDLREYGESLRYLDEILQAEPDNGKALVIRGMILLDQGETDAASACFERALRNLAGSGRTEALLGIAGVAIQRNEIGRAEGIIQDLRQTDDSALAGVALASFLAFQGKFTDGVDLCEKYAKTYPQDERFPVLEGEFLLVLDEPDRSKASLDKALVLNPDSSSAYTILGRYHYLEGRGRESESAYRRAVTLHPGNADAQSELGRLLMERGSYEEAILSMDAAVAKDPRGSAYRSRRGMLMNWIRDIGRAERDFAAAVDLNPADYQSLDGLGYLALQEGRQDDAIAYFEKASTLEPGYAEPHIFQAIAYYQKEEVEKAFEQLKLAESLDPKDPLPHMIAYIIYQDTYRPFASIREAKKALELLPNLKSVNPIEKTQEGISNLGASLLGLGMTEWATSYAEESFDPFEASGYHFVAKKHESNPMVFVSGSTQGFLMDPLSIGYHPRYQDIVAKPHHDLRINTTIGDDGGVFSRDHKITQQGYVRKPFDIKYLLDFENKENNGFRANGDLRENFFTFAFGAKPDYQNGLTLFGGIREKKYGDPGKDTADYEPNDRNRSFGLDLNAGYNHRFGNKNQFLVNFRHSKTKINFWNPDPYGTGLTDAQLSLVDFFGLARTRAYFANDVYDVTNESIIMGPWSAPYFATDSYGGLSLLSSLGLGVTIVPGNLPFSMDPSTTIESEGSRSGYSYQVKHLFEAGDSHKLSWGIEYSPISFDVTSTFRTPKPVGIARFREEYALWGLVGIPTPYARIPYLHAEETSLHLNQDSTFYTVYLNDRWNVTDDLLIDMGLYYERFSNELNTFTDLDPRVGVAWKFHGNHTLRVAYQKRTLEAFDMTLAPVTTAGLFFEWIQLFPGARLTDYQAAVESRWSDRIFTNLGYEIRDYTLPEFGVALYPRENRAHIITAAVNAILTDALGVYARYKYTDSENREEPFKGNKTPLVPMHTGAAGLVCVLPHHVKATLSANYAAKQYGDDANTYRLPEMLTTDFSATWEPMRKHVMIKLGIKNIFDDHYETEMHYPAARRSVFLTFEYRF